MVAFHNHLSYIRLGQPTLTSFATKNEQTIINFFFAFGSNDSQSLLQTQSIRSRGRASKSIHRGPPNLVHIHKGLTLYHTRDLYQSHISPNLPQPLFSLRIQQQEQWTTCCIVHQQTQVRHLCAQHTMNLKVRHTNDFGKFTSLLMIKRLHQ